MSNTVFHLFFSHKLFTLTFHFHFLCSNSTCTFSFVVLFLFMSLIQQCQLISLRIICYIFFFWDLWCSCCHTQSNGRIYIFMIIKWWTYDCIYIYLYLYLNFPTRMEGSILSPALEALEHVNVWRGKNSHKIFIHGFLIIRYKNTCLNCRDQRFNMIMTLHNTNFYTSWFRKRLKLKHKGFNLAAQILYRDYQDMKYPRFNLINYC